jgi:hypothetical protein
MALLSDRRLADNANDSESTFYRGKLRASRYFAEYELPRVKAWLAPLIARVAIFDEMSAAELFAS